MTKEIKHIIAYIIMWGVGIFAVFFFLLILIVWINGNIQDIKGDTYCEKLYPSPIKNSGIFETNWGETSNTEKGYIKCCRYTWQEHEKVKECQIYPYKKK